MKDKIKNLIIKFNKAFFNFLKSLIQNLFSPMMFMIAFYFAGAIFICEGAREYFGEHAFNFVKGSFLLFSAYYIYKGLKR